jgi:hypothetical protein
VKEKSAIENSTHEDQRIRQSIFILDIANMFLRALRLLFSLSTCCLPGSVLDTKCFYDLGIYYHLSIGQDLGVAKMGSLFSVSQVWKQGIG